MNAVDTNVLVHSADSNEPVKQSKAQHLLRQLILAGGTVMLWQVLVESVQQMRRWKDRGDLTEAEFDQHILDFRLLFPVAFPSITTLNHALNLAKRHSLSHWDSMILGACKDAGVTTPYTEDMGAPATIDGISLINPF